MRQNSAISFVFILEDLSLDALSNAGTSISTGLFASSMGLLDQLCCLDFFHGFVSLQSLSSGSDCFFLGLKRQILV